MDLLEIQERAIGARGASPSRTRLTGQSTVRRKTTRSTPQRKRDPLEAPSRVVRETVAVQDALLYVVVGVVAVSALIAVVALAGSGKAYDQIGRGGLSLRDGSDRPAAEAHPSAGSALRERDEEVRQLLEARNARRVARGEAPLDVEAELRRLTAMAGGVEPQLRAEVRQLVVARNERRARQGRAPLDVEAEVERQLRDLGAT
jgi:hypothetical protein